MTNSRKARAKKLAKKLGVSHQGATNLMRQQQDQDLQTRVRDAAPFSRNHTVLFDRIDDAAPWYDHDEGPLLVLDSLHNGVATFRTIKARFEIRPRGLRIPIHEVSVADARQLIDDLLADKLDEDHAVCPWKPTRTGLWFGMALTPNPIYNAVGSPPWYQRKFEVIENGLYLPLPPESFDELVFQIREFLKVNPDYRLLTADDPKAHYIGFAAVAPGKPDRYWQVHLEQLRHEQLADALKLALRSSAGRVNLTAAIAGIDSGAIDPREITSGEPPIVFATKRAEITPADTPRGMSADDVTIDLDTEIPLSQIDIPPETREAFQAATTATAAFNEGLTFELAEPDEILKEPVWTQAETRLQQEVEDALRHVNQFAIPYKKVSIRFENEDGTLWGSGDAEDPPTPYDEIRAQIDINAHVQDLLQRKVWIVRRAWNLHFQEVSLNSLPSDLSFEGRSEEDCVRIIKGRHEWHKTGIFERFGYLSASWSARCRIWA